MGVNKKVKNIIMLGCISFTALFFGILYFLVAENPSRMQVEMDQIKEEFTEDYSLLRIIVDYFALSSNTSVHIRLNEDCLGSLVKNSLIIDENVVDAMEELRSRGYQIIARNNNIIRFLRSTRGRHFGNGIVYSIDGIEPNYGTNPRSPLYGSISEPTQIMYLTKLKPLSSQNWFYYESDFREWRLRYQP